MSDRNGGSENENSNWLRGMKEHVQEQSRLHTLRHEQTMAEIAELITLQKEQRIDTMALFQANKDLRDLFATVVRQITNKPEASA